MDDILAPRLEGEVQYRECDEPIAAAARAANAVYDAFRHPTRGSRQSDKAMSNYALKYAGISQMDMQAMRAAIRAYEAEKAKIRRGLKVVD